MSETYKFLGNLEELKFWWMYGMRKLTRQEVYFISTSARNKQLNEEERLVYQVGRSEMWHKEIIPEDDFGRFLRAVRRCEANKRAYLTKAEVPFPDKVLVLYCNICPTDAWAAMKEQMNYLNATQIELTDSILKNSITGTDNSFKNIRHCHTTGQSVFARSFSDREWTDIDCDISDFEAVDGWKAIDDIKRWLYAEAGMGNFMQIQTSGGFHWLVRKQVLADMGRKFRKDPVGEIILQMAALLKDKCTMNEIVRNKNEMIPMPGTLQYGTHLVTVENKDDFKAITPYHEYPVYDDEHRGNESG
jgi:hypothetical protein